MTFVIYRPQFQIADLTDRALGHLLDCLIAIDMEQLQNFPEIPPLYSSGVRYVFDGRVDDPWMDALSTLRAKGGDCEDLACWRAAELRVRFRVAATATFIRKKFANGNELIHIFVRKPGEEYEDPSVMLGMRTLLPPA